MIEVVQEFLIKVATRAAAWPWYFKLLLGFATVVTVTDLLLKRFAPHSRFYAGFKHALESIGAFWTAIILSVVYFGSVALVNLGFRLSGHDPLDRALDKEPSFWRKHDPNPLGPAAAVRHQF